MTNSSNIAPLITLGWDRSAGALAISVGTAAIVALLVIALLLLIWRWWRGGLSWKQFEIDQAEIGVGRNKLRFRPNSADRQVAYAIWVELSTRKIGLPIDFEHDVVAEIYDSWFNFFTVTRDLVKGIPVNQVKRHSTQSIIKLSIEVLNEGLRPHLTRWQARFRRWYERELKRYDEAGSDEVLYPQQIQARFPEFDELKDDMQRVNEALIRYRRKMHQLVLKD